MAKFIEIPSFDIYRDGKWAEPEEWWLDGRCVYQSDLLDEEGNPIRVEVEDGASTDLASIPRPARLLIPKNDNHRAPAVIHDHLCKTGEVSREVADKIFLEAMQVVDAEIIADAEKKPGRIRRAAWWLRRYAMYAAVRIGAKME